jgi:hypothetical protein
VATAVAREIREEEAVRDDAAMSAVAGLTPEHAKIVYSKHPSGRGTRFRLGQHVWWSRDADARTRAYHKHGRRVLPKRAWHVYINVKAIDRITRAPLALAYFPADQNGCSVYPEVYKAVKAATGVDPRAVVGDRG